MDSQRTKLNEIIDSYRTAMLVTTTEDGAIRARPMVIARNDEDGKLWFVTNIDSTLLEEVLAHPDCAVTMQDSTTFLSVSGTCYARRDDRMMSELWSKMFELWFDKDQAVLIEFQGREAEYWSKGLGGLKFLFEATRAALVGDRIRPDKVGDHAHVTIP